MLIDGLKQDDRFSLLMSIVVSSLNAICCLIIIGLERGYTPEFTRATALVILRGSEQWKIQK